MLEKYAQTSIPIPEPEDPLVNLMYLAWPVTQIIDPQSSLSDLIEACIRAAMTDLTDGDMSWPLFQPLHKHTQALIDGICLDLARAPIEPDTVMIPKDGNLLPFPKRSPKKSKIGMSMAQVKLAHNLCMAPHMGLQLFSDIFTSSAKYQLFGITEAQLWDMLTHVLAIPMDEALPTLNACKACMLSIWLLQVQCLAVKFLLPVQDRIAFALCQSMTSELGKEGEKGSACDGLKVSRTTHGPMWVLNVLASFIVLLGLKVCTDIKLTHINKITIGWSVGGDAKRSPVGRGLSLTQGARISWYRESESGEKPENAPKSPRETQENSYSTSGMEK
ncbi:hypothetical protein EDC04DRAFT_2604429 [Pisolithus marmoratus]|nr:hypothetical protein EDC04DRAFT_2604429 [Pisolithus marmoratus]